MDKTYRRDTRYALALRTTFLRKTAHSRERVGQWIRRSCRLNRADPGRNTSLTRAHFIASLLRAAIAQSSKTLLARRGTKPVGTRLPLRPPSERSTNSQDD